MTTSTSRKVPIPKYAKTEWLELRYGTTKPQDTTRTHTLTPEGSSLEYVNGYNITVGTVIVPKDDSALTVLNIASQT